MQLTIEYPAVELPHGVKACTSTRIGGVSSGAYDSLNLALHVGDDRECVILNRLRLSAALKLPAEPCWLNQIHSNRIALSGDADGSFTGMKGTVLGIQTADCLPILLWNDSGDEIAAVHAGWQGLDNGIIKAAVEMFSEGQLSAWIGPHVQSCHYEVDMMLQEKFRAMESAFSPGRDDCHWQLDLAAIATCQLRSAGVGNVVRSESCTACLKDQFFSYRRDGVCGRIASLIWIEP